MHMYCPHCNSVLSDNATICTSCGMPIQKENKEFIAPKKPMRWYYALVYGVLPLSLPGYAYHIYLCVQQEKLWLIPAPVLLAALCVYTMIALMHHRRSGPKALVWLSLLATLLFDGTAVLFYGLNSGFDLIAIAVYGGLFLFFNYLYFEKRSYYFEK